MKNLSALAALMILPLLVFQACTKNSSNDLVERVPAKPDRIIQAKVSPGQVYSVNIDNVGELNIKSQASHFKISQVVNDPQTGSLVYTYTPADNYQGMDEVLLAHKTEYIYSSNSSCGYNSNAAIGSRTSYIAIRLTVADQ